MAAYKEEVMPECFTLFRAIKKLPVLNLLGRGVQRVYEKNIYEFSSDRFNEHVNCRKSIEPYFKRKHILH